MTKRTNTMTDKQLKRIISDDSQGLLRDKTTETRLTYTIKRIIYRIQGHTKGQTQ
jgi:hypothetical protein